MNDETTFRNYLHSTFRVDPRKCENVHDKKLIDFHVKERGVNLTPYFNEINNSSSGNSSGNSSSSSDNSSDNNSL